jgi:hypothetical protein
MTIIRKGRIIAPQSAHIHLSALMPRVYAIASFDDATSPKTQRAMREALYAMVQRYRTESVYAGYIAGKCTYDVLVYSTREERAACFAHVGESVQ